MTFDFEFGLTPDILTVGTGSAITAVGGLSCLRTGGDESYLGISNLDRVNGQGCVLEFPGGNLPAGAIANFYMTVRYEQVSGANSGRPEFQNTTFSGVSLEPLTLATAGAGVIEEDTPPQDTGDWSALFPIAPADVPTQWNLGMAFDITGACDFRIYNVVLVVQYSLPVEPTSTGAPPCRLYPREDHLGVGSGRIWPPPKSHQASNRRAGGYY